MGFVLIGLLFRSVQATKSQNVGKVGFHGLTADSPHVFGPSPAQN